jgi:hypothetical protein
MIARARRAAFALAALTSAASFVSCQRVPLLAPNGSTITLSALATTLPVNGSSQIIATVLESSGTPPHSGTHVIFTTTLGSVQPSDVETDIGGRATTTFNAGTTSGTATITANSGAATGGTTGGTGSTTSAGLNQVKIAIGAAAVGSVSVSATPGTISANGGNATVAAKVLDTGGNPLPSVSVTFSTDFGSLNPNVANSDTNGTATTTLTTSKTSKVTATAGITGASGTTGPSGTVTVNVNTPAGVAVGAASPATPVAGQAVTFSITYTTTNASPIVRLVADWGDNSNATTFTGAPGSISHTYNAAGTFAVRVIATDSFGDVSTAGASVTVSNRPQPTVQITVPTTPSAGSAAIFGVTATATPNNFIQNVFVDFGDGSQQTLQGNVTSLQHVYQNGGTFQVTVIATDTSGLSGSATAIVVVTGGAATAAFTISPSTGLHPATISVNGSTSTSPSQIQTYAWDFGDPGSAGNQVSGSSATQTHIYNGAGTFTITLTITDSAGRTAVKTNTITIT